jgi:hypothetical protein
MSKIYIAGKSANSWFRLPMDKEEITSSNFLINMVLSVRAMAMDTENPFQ